MKHKDIVEKIENYIYQKLRRPTAQGHAPDIYFRDIQRIIDEGRQAVWESKYGQ